jgi:hypothetical protein
MVKRTNPVKIIIFEGMPKELHIKQGFSGICDKKIRLK